MHLGPLRTFYTHNTCISYVTPVCLYIAHRILFSYQAYRSLPEPSSKPESEKKSRGNSMEEDVSQSGIRSAKHAQFPCAHMCPWTIPTGAYADTTGAWVSQDNGSLLRVGRPSVRRKEEAATTPKLCSWTSSKWERLSGNRASSWWSPNHVAFSGSRQDQQGWP